MGPVRHDRAPSVMGRLKATTQLADDVTASCSAGHWGMQGERYAPPADTDTPRGVSRSSPSHDVAPVTSRRVCGSLRRRARAARTHIQHALPSKHGLPDSAAGTEASGQAQRLTGQPLVGLKSPGARPLLQLCVPGDGAAGDVHEVTAADRPDRETRAAFADQPPLLVGPAVAVVLHEGCAGAGPVVVDAQALAAVGVA
jgi:hypothetical protein